MSLRTRLLGYVSTLYLVAATAGCALSPQVVVLAPKLSADTAFAGGQKTVALEVQDLRNSTLIGTRGGVYKHTSTIHSQADIREPLNAEISRVLLAHGFTVIASNGGDPITLAVALEALTYAANGSAPVTIEVEAVVSATARNGDRTLNKRYTDSHSEQSITVPDTEKNEHLINQSLARLFQRMLNDESLLVFLDN